MTALWIVLALLAAALATIFIIVRRKIMTFEESLKDVETFHLQAVQQINAAIASIPNKLSDLIPKIIADYEARNPDRGGSISNEALVEHMQTMIAQTKVLYGAEPIVELYFDQAMKNGPGENAPTEPQPTEMPPEPEIPEIPEG